MFLLLHYFTFVSISLCVCVCSLFVLFASTYRDFHSMVDVDVNRRRRRPCISCHGVRQRGQGCRSQRHEFFVDYTRHFGFVTAFSLLFLGTVKPTDALVGWFSIEGR